MLTTARHGRLTAARLDDLHAVTCARWLGAGRRARPPGPQRRRMPLLLRPLAQGHVDRGEHQDDASQGDAAADELGGIDHDEPL
jgi:hypothetical protein